MRLKNIYARVDQKCLEKLGILAKMRNQSTSELIRKIVTDYFADAVDPATAVQPLVLPYEYDVNDLELDSKHHNHNNTDDDFSDTSDADTVEATTLSKGLFVDRPLVDFDPDKQPMAVNFIELDW